MDIIERISRTFGLSGKEEETTIDKDNDNPQGTSNEQEAIPQNILSFNPAPSKENSPRPEKYVKSKITTIKPKDFNDAQTVANCLRDNIPVIVNFEETDNGEATRMIDFISGTIYAIDGKIKRVSQKVFICAPNNVTVSSSEEDQKFSGKFLD